MPHAAVPPKGRPSRRTTKAGRFSFSLPSPQTVQAPIDGLPWKRMPVVSWKRAAGWLSLSQWTDRTNAMRSTCAAVSWKSSLTSISAFAVARKAKRARDDESILSARLIALDLVVTLEEGPRVAREDRLRVERVHLTRPALHEEEDASACSGREVWALGRERVLGVVRSGRRGSAFGCARLVSREKPAQSDASDARAEAEEDVPAIGFDLEGAARRRRAA